MWLGTIRTEWQKNSKHLSIREVRSTRFKSQETPELNQTCPIMPGEWAYSTLYIVTGTNSFVGTSRKAASMECESSRPKPEYYNVMVQRQSTPIAGPMPRRNTVITFRTTSSIVWLPPKLCSIRKAEPLGNIVTTHPLRTTGERTMVLREDR